MEYRTVRLAEQVMITVPRDRSAGQEADLVQMYESGTDPATVEAIARALHGDWSQMYSLEDVLKDLEDEPPANEGAA